MRTRALLALTTFVAFCALLSPTLGVAAVADHFCLLLDTPATLANPVQTAQRNSYVVLQAWETERAAQLKADNPDLLVLVYQNLSAMAEGTGPGGLSSSGVNYTEANSAHLGWFLKNPSDHRIAEDGYGWLWMADIGAPGYQQQWTANVIDILKNGPWDGVLMDDTNTTAKYHVGTPSKIAKYPTDETYQGVVGSMLAYAGPRIQAAGKLAIPNMGSWSEYPEVVEEWLRFVSGGVDEMFVKWSSIPGEGYRSPREWQAQVKEIETTERMGKRFLAVTQAVPSDTQAIRYGWASALLGANGHTAFLAAGAYTGDSWSSDYEIPLGEPISSARRFANGVWRRAFTGGLVVVNPTASTLSVGLGGIYSGSGLADVEEATLASHSALILTREEPASGEVSTPTYPASIPPVGGHQPATAGPTTGAKGTRSPAAVTRCRHALKRGNLSARHRARCKSILRSPHAEANRHSDSV